MRFTGLLLVLAPVLGVVGCTAGCAPINFAAFDANSTGVGGSSSTGSFGGAYVDFDAGGAGSTGSGDGGMGVLPPTSYGYLCGGSQPGCSTDPALSDCAPGGNAGMGGGAPDGSTLTCQLTTDGAQIQAACGMAGPAGNGDVCTGPTGCQAGLGCVATSVADLAVCQEFCCGDREACPSATYCKKTPLIGTELEIPVCAPVTPCALLDDAHCPSGQTCTIVRTDGTTTCTDAGQSKTDGPCPCAAGYTCSNATGTCLKLCHIGSSDCGPGGTCQGGTKPYPVDIGFCVTL
jgi:hypothetical protein